MSIGKDKICLPTSREICSHCGCSVEQCQSSKIGCCPDCDHYKPLRDAQSADDKDQNQDHYKPQNQDQEKAIVQRVDRRCSRCKQFCAIHGRDMPYCPNCGAKLTGVEGSVGRVTCETCKGVGYTDILPSGNVISCQTCKGKGYVQGRGKRLQEEADFSES